MYFIFIFTYDQTAHQLYPNMEMTDEMYLEMIVVYMLNRSYTCALTIKYLLIFSKW